MLCWTYLIASVVLFLYPVSFPIHSIQQTSIREGIVMGIFSYLHDTYPVRASYFLLV